MLHVLSTLVLLLIAAGLYYRRRAEFHLRFMTAAFVADLSLVLWIETTRGAVETVTRGGKALLWVHAGISVLVLVLYVVQILLGRLLLARRSLPVPAAGPLPAATPATNRTLHRNLGIAFVALRSLNYVTAFML